MSSSTRLMLGALVVPTDGVCGLVKSLLIDTSVPRVVRLRLCRWDFGTNLPGLARTGLMPGSRTATGRQTNWWVQALLFEPRLFLWHATSRVARPAATTLAMPGPVHRQATSSVQRPQQGPTWAAPITTARRHGACISWAGPSGR